MVRVARQTIEVSDEPELKKARDLIANIRKRKLYKLADEYILPADVSKRVPKVCGMRFMLPALPCARAMECSRAVVVVVGR